MPGGGFFRLPHLVWGLSAPPGETPPAGNLFRLPYIIWGLSAPRTYMVNEKIPGMGKYLHYGRYSINEKPLRHGKHIFYGRFRLTENLRRIAFPLREIFGHRNVASGI